MTETLLVPPEVRLPDLDLPTEDGEFLESRRHRIQMNLSIEILQVAWRDRSDFFVGGNMFVYYSLEQARQVIAELEGKTPKRTAYRGPDVFVVLNVEGSRERQNWVVWEEGGRYPDVVIELLSPSTVRTDLTVKKDLYERVFRTPEYFVWDPFDPTALAGWRLSVGVYQPIAPDEHGWIWSEELKLWLGPWTGKVQGQAATWLRYYDSESRLVLTEAEAERQARLEAEQRAEALAAEVARLRSKRGRSSSK